MLNTADFFEFVTAKGVDFSTGVPDSLLKDFCAYVADNSNDIIAANEGACIGIAAGYHLATGKIPLVYMQNSGFGNTINPLTSLTDPDVYSIPMLLMVGWRGRPGVKDEPQHVKMGRINEAMIQSLEIPYCILSKDMNEAQKQVDAAFEFMQKEKAPYILLIEKETFEPYKLQSAKPDTFPMSRERAIEILLQELNDDDVMVSTTGKTSREVFEVREARNEPHFRDFLCVGNMGHTSQIALGIALGKPDKRVICLDGDGSFLMHMGSTAIIGGQEPDNLKYILINNGAHESVGGQPTVGFTTDFKKIAEACNYKSTFSASSEQELQEIMPGFLTSAGPSMLEVNVKKGSRKDLGRPTIKPVDNKVDFMKNLGN